MYVAIMADLGTTNQVITTWAVTKAIANTKTNTASSEKNAKFCCLKTLAQNL